jgi:hypothetical protein
MNTIRSFLSTDSMVKWIRARKRRYDLKQQISATGELYYPTTL